MLVVNKEIQFKGRWEYFQYFRTTLGNVADDKRLWALCKQHVKDGHMIGTPFCRALREFDINKSSAYLSIQSDGIAAIRRGWSAQFCDSRVPSFDSVFGCWPWDTADVLAFPDDMQVLEKHWFITDWRMFLWRV